MGRQAKLKKLRKASKEFDEEGVSHFSKSITQSDNNPKVSAPLKKADLQNWDIPDEEDELIVKGFGVAWELFNEKSISSLNLESHPENGDALIDFFCSFERPENMTDDEFDAFFKEKTLDFINDNLK